jgi:hypothetical protein
LVAGTRARRATVTVQLHRPVPVERPPDERRRPAPHALPALVVTGKVILLLAVVRIVIEPAWGNLEGKAPMARAIMYPLLAMAVPVLWATTRRHCCFPWLADLLFTLACFADILGNRLDLYDSIVWFDDWMHIMNTGLVSAAFVILTVRESATIREIAEVAVSFGLSASLGWELFEYATFLTRSTEWTSAYSDTIGDLTLGWLGAVLAALAVALAWRRRGASGSYS